MTGKRLRDAVFIILGTTLLALATGLFYSPNHLVVGGFSGIGIVLETVTASRFGRGIPVSLTNLVLNIPLLIIANRYMGKKFILKTAFATVFYSVVMYVCDYLPHYEGDMILVCIYGGIIQGAGMGFVLLGKGSTGGVDLLSSIIHKFISYISISKLILIFDTAIILAGVFVFGMDKAMYGIISIFIGTKCISAILEGMSFSKAALIISPKSDEIAREIMSKVNRGVTALNGKGMYTGHDTDVLLCVFAQKEIMLVKDIVSEIDKNAFVLVTDVKEVLGNGFTELIPD